MCSHSGCYSRETSQYEYPDGQLVRYCSKHNTGFCIWCGQFWAGVEDFDFSQNQLCSNCRCFDCGQPLEICECEYEDCDYGYNYSEEYYEV